MIVASRTLLRSAIAAVLVVIGCASAPKKSNDPTPRPSAACTSGRDCRDDEYCVMPFQGGAPRPENEPGSCQPIPKECNGTATCACVMAARGDEAACAPAGAGPRGNVCSFADGALRCGCMMCP